MEASVIQTRAAHFTISDKDIVHITWDSKRLSLEDCSISISNAHSHSKYRPLYYISDIRAVRGMTKRARDYFKSPDFQQVTGGIALLVGNGISKMTANFFIGFRRTHYPIKAFTNKEAALDWLMSIKMKE